MRPDQSDARRFHSRLESGHERQILRTMFEIAPDAVVVTDNERRFITINSAAEQLFGYSEKELTGRSARLVYETDEQFQSADQHWRKTNAPHTPRPLTLRRKDGSTFTASVLRHPLTDTTGRITAYLTIVRDITRQLNNEVQLHDTLIHLKYIDTLAATVRQEMNLQQTEHQRVEQALQRSEADLRRLAYQDPLTGLANRTQLMEQLRLTLDAQHVQSDSFALLFIDFDRFKLINDTMGQDIGDQLLISIARRLNEQLREPHDHTTGRPHGLAARMGGDEFVILLHGLTDTGPINRFAAHLPSVLTVPHNLAGQSLTCTASIGIVHVLPGQYDRPEQVVRDADIAMYEAKTTGRARCAWFDQPMRDRMIERALLETDLRQALADRQFHLEFQPIFSLDTGRVAGFEAMLRWNNPRRGAVEPSAFLPIMQEMGLAVPLGQWVMREACSHRRSWQTPHADASAIKLHINLFSEQMVDDHTAALITQTLRDVNMPASSLMLEIPKSIFSQPQAIRMQGLELIHRTGVGLAIDNFGLGSTSLVHLHPLPPRQIKLPLSLVRNMQMHIEYAEIVQATITLAHSLGMTVVAEGVETEAQLAQLWGLANF